MSNKINNKKQPEKNFGNSFRIIKVTENPKHINIYLTKNERGGGQFLVYNFIIKNNNNGICISVPFSLISSKQFLNRNNSYIKKLYNNLNKKEHNNFYYYKNVILNENFKFKLDFFIMEEPKVQISPTNQKVTIEALDDPFQLLLPFQLLSPLLLFHLLQLFQLL